MRLWLRPIEERNLDWHNISLDVVRQVCPDKKNAIDCFPSHWSAAEMSRFCFFRTDFPIFVLLYTCLFSEVVNRSGVAETKLLKLVASEAFLNAAKAHVEQTGFAAHPFNLIQSLLLR